MTPWYNPRQGTWLIKGTFSDARLLVGSGAFIDAISGTGTVVVTYSGDVVRVFASGEFQYQHTIVDANTTGADVELVATGVSTLIDMGYLSLQLDDVEASDQAVGSVDLNYSPSIFLQNTLYSSGERGVFLVPSPTVDNDQVLFQDSAGTSEVTAGGDPVGLVVDQSGNSFDAVQSVSTARPVFLTAPNRIRLDGVDDNLLIDFGSAFTGDVFQGTPRGIIHMEVSTADGVWSLAEDPMYVPDSGEITGVVTVEGSVDAAREQAIEEYLIDRGAGVDFAGVASMSNWFNRRTDITKIYSGNWNTANVTDFRDFAFLCSSLTTVTVNGGAGNPFSDSPCTDYTAAFSGTNLTQKSIDDILVAIESAGTSNGVFDQSGGSAPSATGEAAIDALRARGWIVTVTGGY